MRASLLYLILLYVLRITHTEVLPMHEVLWQNGATQVHHQHYHRVSVAIARIIVEF